MHAQKDLAQVRPIHWGWGQELAWGRTQKSRAQTVCQGSDWRPHSSSASPPQARSLRFLHFHQALASDPGEGVKTSLFQKRTRYVQPFPPQLGAEVTSHKRFSHLAPFLTLRNVFFFPGCPVLSQLRSNLNIWQEFLNTKATKGSYLRTSRGQMACQSPQLSWSRAAAPLRSAFYYREVRGIPFYIVLDFCLVLFLPLFRSVVPLVLLVFLIYKSSLYIEYFKQVIFVWSIFVMKTS